MNRQVRSLTIQLPINPPPLAVNRLTRSYLNPKPICSSINAQKFIIEPAHSLINKLIISQLSNRLYIFNLQPGKSNDRASPMLHHKMPRDKDTCITLNAFLFHLRSPSGSHMCSIKCASSIKKTLCSCATVQA